MTTAPPAARRGAWARARELAERTPEARNRYVDFLRAASICVVVLGHWLMAAVFVDGGELRATDMLHRAPWTQWLTWALQVMPLFFIVGGYSNAASWEAALRTGQGYPAWAGTRLRRLVLPVVPLVLTWAALALAARRFGVDPQMVRLGSQAALIPTWFLAVYVMVVVAAPATHWAWRRFGMASLWALLAGAAVVDAIAFSADFFLLRWVNYGFVWLGVHHLGYLWRAGRIGGAGALAWAAGGLALLAGLVGVAGYPVSMISVPGAEVSNSRPPTLALLALGLFHGGLVIAVEAPLRRWLLRLGPWTATVLVNGTIMTLYLWHVTAMVLVISLSNVLGGVGLGAEPDSAAWWWSRPLWIAVLGAALFPFVAAFGRYESAARGGGGAPPAAWRTVSGAMAVCAGLAYLALGGIGDDGWLGLRVGAVALTLGGAALVAAGPIGRRAEA